MPIFVRVDGETCGFWEVEREGSTVVTRWGVLGGRGEEEARELADEENAAALVEQLVAARRAKGFVPLDEADLAPAHPGGPSGASREQDDAFRENGWQRLERRQGDRVMFWAVQIVDGELLRTRSGLAGARGREETVACKDYWEAQRRRAREVRRRFGRGYLPADRGVRMAENPELEAAILAEPDARERWLVYADWLQAAGDPRGELMMLDHALAAGGAPPDAQERRRELIERYADFLLPSSLQQHVGDRESPCAATWRLGFLDSLRLAGAHDDGESDPGALVLEALQHPSARFLRELAIGPVSSFDYGEVVREIAAAAPPLLRSLHLADFTWDDCELSWTSLGDVSPLYPALPRLERLILRGGSMELGRIVLPALRSFEVQTGGLSAASIRSITTAEWPELRALRIWFGQAGYGAEGDLTSIAPILAGEGLPRLETLGLMNAEFASSICDALPDAPVLRGLRVLDLSMGTMTDAAARRLVARAGRLRHLEQIHVERCFLSGEGQRLLEQIGPEIVFGEQREPYDYHDELYAAVGE